MTIDIEGAINEIINREKDMFGSSSIGRAVTGVSLVSMNGSGVDGQLWDKSFTTIQAALINAGTENNDYDAELILIAPSGATYFDMDTTGVPTYSANVILKGTHRNWPKVKNDHASATAIMKLTGRSSVIDLNFNLGTGNNGLIQTRGGARTRHCQFVGEDLTGAATALWYDTAAQKHFKMDDCDFLGHATHMTAFKVDDLCCSEFTNFRVHDCLKGIHIIGANADRNLFDGVDIGDCAIGIDIDAGNEQHFNNINLHGNTVNVDDEVKDHIWNNIHGAFPITTVPDDLSGITVTAGVGANTWSAANTQIKAAAGKLFRIVGVVLDPDAAEKYRVRLYDGTTYFDDKWAEGGVGVAAMASSAPSGTEYIFNEGIVISASAKSESGGNDIDVSLQVQEI